MARPTVPSVSVALATYNGERHLREQLVSIARQTYPVDQLVIVDDASTDATLSLVEAFEREGAIGRIDIVRHTTNRGVWSSFEEALHMTRGDVVFLSDQDDVWLPRKVERCVRAWSAGRAHVFMHDFDICDAALVRTGVRGFRRNAPSPDSPEWSFQGMAMFGTGAFFRACVPFGTGHDTWIGLVGRLTGCVQAVPEVLALHRRHDGNVTPLDSRFAVTGRRLRSKLRSAFHDRLMHRQGSLDAYVYKTRRAVSTLKRLREDPSLFRSPSDVQRLADAIERAREARRIAKRRHWIAGAPLRARLPRVRAVLRKTRPDARLLVRYLRDALVAEAFRSA